MLSAAEGLVDFFELVDEGLGGNGALVGWMGGYVDEERAEGGEEGERGSSDWRNGVVDGLDKQIPKGRAEVEGLDDRICVAG
jgi:hypothetical protein